MRTSKTKFYARYNRVIYRPAAIRILDGKPVIVLIGAITARQARKLSYWLLHAANELDRQIELRRRGRKA